MIYYWYYMIYDFCSYSIFVNVHLIIWLFELCFNKYCHSCFFKELIIASKDGDYNLTKQLIEDGASLEEFDIYGKLFTYNNGTLIYLMALITYVH